MSWRPLKSFYYINRAIGGLDMNGSLLTVFLKKKCHSIECHSAKCHGALQRPAFRKKLGHCTLSIMALKPILMDVRMHKKMPCC
jgi:hypothetical protein